MGATVGEKVVLEWCQMFVLQYTSGLHTLLNLDVTFTAVKRVYRGCFLQTFFYESARLAPYELTHVRAPVAPKGVTAL